jgi:MinD-like ATPase involved in chromosome partitioning or flagellar assembly
VTWIVTFYSYKGGTGRTMALANVAVLLARGGSSVLAVDFDLEAPGLDRFLQPVMSGNLRAKPGLVELLEAAAANDGEADWRTHVSSADLDGGSLTMLAAGRADDSYNERVLRFDWTTFFAERNGGAFIEHLRDDWKEAFDYVLIDSRTGITDTGGVCTIQLPDVLIPVITPNQQSIDGTKDVVARAQAARQALSYDRPPLLVFPLASRFDTRTELETSNQWLERLAHSMRDAYADWLPRSFAPLLVLERTKLPHVSFYSFGEALPAERDRLSDPETLGYAYRVICELVRHEFANVPELIGQEMLPTTESDRLQALASQADFSLSSLPKPEQRRAWAILTRLAVPTESDASTRLASTTVEPDEDIAAKLRSLGLVESTLGSLRLASEDLVRAWPELEERIAADRRFLADMAQVRAAAESRTPLDELLGAAMGWYVERREDMLAVERRHIELSYDVRRRARTRLRVGPSWLIRDPWLRRIAAGGFGIAVLILALGRLVLSETLALQAAAVVAITTFLALYIGAFLVMSRGRSAKMTTRVGKTRDRARFLQDIAAELAVRGYSTDAIPDTAVFSARKTARAAPIAIPGPEVIAYIVRSPDGVDFAVVEAGRVLARQLTEGTDFELDDESRDLPERLFAQPRPAPHEATAIATR